MTATRSWVTWLAAACVVMGVASSCVSRDGSSASGTGGTNPSLPTGGDVPTSTPSSPQQYKDRDADQVAEGIAKVDDPDTPDDNCALLSLAVLDEHGFPERTHGAAAPNELLDVQPSCRATSNDVWSEVTITLGEEFSESAHYGMAPFDVGGFIAYWGDATIRADADQMCEVRIPVSFTKGITFRVKRNPEYHQFDQCAIAKGLAAEAVPTIVQLAGPELLYKTGEQHENAEGACLDWIGTGGVRNNRCVPGRETPVPDDPQQLMRAAQSNGHVACAMARDDVREVLGEHMKPVVIDGKGCVFVEPTHEIELTISLDDSFAPADYFELPPEDITVSKHPGVKMVKIEQNHIDVIYYISTGDDATKRGLVNATLAIVPPRGTSSWVAKSDQSKMTIALPVMERLMNRFR